MQKHLRYCSAVQPGRVVRGSLCRIIGAAGLVASGACIKSTQIGMESAPSADSSTASVVADVAKLEGSMARLVASVDVEANPCESFYAYACGAWEKNVAHSNDGYRVSRLFDGVESQNEQHRERVLDAALRQHSTAAQRTVASFYSSCLATLRAEVDDEGRSPELQRALERVAATNNFVELLQTVGELARGVLPVHAIEDPMNGSAMPYVSTLIVPYFESAHPTYQVFIEPGRLVLSDPRAYRLEGAEQHVALAGYRRELARLLRYAGATTQDVDSRVRGLMELEKKLAVLTPPQQVRFARMGENPTEYRLLDGDDASLWSAYLGRLGLDGRPFYFTRTPEYFEQLMDSIRDVSLQAHKDYVSVWVIRALGELTDRQLRIDIRSMQHIRGHGNKFESVEKECAALTEFALPQQFGSLLAQAPEATDLRSQAIQIANDIRFELEQSFLQSPWMDTETRTVALEKLENVEMLIGYPDQWSTASPLPVSSKRTLLGNFQLIWAQTYQQKLMRVDGAWQQTSWPALGFGGAWYSPENAIIVPLGMLRDPALPEFSHPAIAYGSLGSIIGHEFVHGFDDLGRRFDAQRRRRDWWSELALTRYQSSAKCLVEEYEACEVVPGIPGQGEYRLAENIADLGGLRLAYDAYRQRRGAAIKSRVAGTNWTEEQLFFIAHAQNNCESFDAERSAEHLYYDPHSIAQCRVDPPMRHIPEFAEAFSCQPAQPMYSKKSCSVW